MLSFRPFLIPVLAGLMATASAQSGVVSGSIVDTQGNPVRNAYFEVDPMSGNDLPFVSGGYTDASGHFTTTIEPQGDYRFTIFPLPAPQSLVVTRRVENIAVGATPNDLGTIVMELGVELSGRVVNSVGTPLVEVDLEFVGASGQPLDFSNSHTDSAGRFTVAMPFGSSEFHCIPGAPPYYGGPGSAPLSLELELDGPRNLGDIVLPAGVGLAGTLIDSEGSPVEDAKFRLFDVATQRFAFIPKDKSDEFGGFSATIVPGTYDLQILPDDEDLAPREVLGLQVPPASFLGTLVLQPGFTVSGTVRGSNNAKQGNVRVRVEHSANGQAVFTGDPVLTKTNGLYEFVAAAGTYDLEFSPPFSVPFGPTDVLGLSVSGNRSQNVTLPALAFFTTTGSGLPGLGGITPQISATGGTPRVGNTGYALECSLGCGGAPALVEHTFGPPRGPTYGSIGGPLRKGWKLIRLGGAAGLAGAGTGRFPLPIPDDLGLVGQAVRARFFVLDASAVGGRAMTSELGVTLSR